MIDASGTAVAVILAWAQVQRVEDFPASMFDRAMDKMRMNIKALKTSAAVD